MRSLLARKPDGSAQYVHYALASAGAASRPIKLLLWENIVDDRRRGEREQELLIKFKPSLNSFFPAAHGGIRPWRDRIAR